MNTYHCPKCDSTFRHENAEAVFCPKCGEQAALIPRNKTIPFCLFAAFNTIIGVGMFLFTVPWVLMSDSPLYFLTHGLISLILFLPTLILIFRNKKERGAIFGTVCLTGLAVYIFFIPVVSLFDDIRIAGHQGEFEQMLTQHGLKTKHFEDSFVSFEYPALFSERPLQFRKDAYGLVFSIPEKTTSFYLANSPGLFIEISEFPQQKRIDQELAIQHRQPENVVQIGEIKLPECTIVCNGYISRGNVKIKSTPYDSMLCFQVQNFSVMIRFRYSTFEQKDFDALLAKMVNSFQIKDAQKFREQLQKNTTQRRTP